MAEQTAPLSDYDYIFKNLQRMDKDGVSQAHMDEWLRTPSEHEDPNKRGGGVAPNAVGWKTFLAQGATLGTADEISAGLQGLTGGDYQKALAVARFGMEKYRQEHGARALIAEIGGAFIPTVGAMLLAPFTSGGSAVGTFPTLARIGHHALKVFSPSKKLSTNVGRGGAVGSLYAAGTEEGGAAQRAAAMPFGALFGGGGAGTLDLAGRMLSPLYRGMTRGSTATTGRQIGDEAILRQLAADDLPPSRVSGEVSRLQRGIDPNDATPALRTNLQPRVSNVNVVPPGPAGVLSGRILPGETAPDATLRTTLGAEPPLKPVVAADLGESTRALVEAANLTPGRGSTNIKRFFGERDLGPEALHIRRGQPARGFKTMVERLTDDLELAFGKNAKYFTEFKALKDARKAEGDRLYGLAGKRNIEVTSELLGILESKPGLEALTDAVDLAAHHVSGGRAVKLARLVINDKGQLVNDRGQVVKAVKTEFLHYVKMAMDDNLDIVSSMGVKQGGNWKKSLVRERSDDLKNLLSDANPDYKIALNAYSNKSAMMRAMTAGRDFLKPSTNVDELADALDNFGTVELEAFRVGAMSALIDNIEGAIRTGNIAHNLTKTTRNKKLLRLSFPKGEVGDIKFNEFINRLTTEVDMKITSGRVLGGSQTAARLELMNFLKDATTRGAPTIDGVQAWVFKNLQKNAEALTDETMEVASRRIAEVMTETDPAKLSVYMDQLLTKQGAMELAGSVLTDLTAASGRAAVAPGPVGTASGIATERLNLQEPTRQAGRYMKSGLLGLVN